MGTIKNLNCISDYLSDEDIEKLTFGASLYKRHGNISFKILEVDKKQITVEVKQEKNAPENYLNKNELIERAEYLFGKFLPNHAIHGRPLAFSGN